MKFLGTALLLLLLAGIAAGLHEYGLTLPVEEGLLQVLTNDSREPGDVRIPILVYHQVDPNAPRSHLWQHEYGVTPEMLERQFAYLHDQGYTVISMQDLDAMVAVGTITVQKPVVLTFDDGWQSQFDYALPLLTKYGYTATFYIYTKAIGTIPSAMAWNEIRTLSAAGMTIGDHTLSHTRLSGLSESELQHEIGDAKKLIESETGVPVIDFASPYGYSSSRVVRVLHDEGFATGRTTYRGVYQSPGRLLALRAYLVTNSFEGFTRYLSEGN